MYRPKNVHHAVQGFARFGYAAKGVVYMLIGALALSAALGSGRAGDSREAMTALRDKPFGKVVLGIIGLGLLAYALWRMYSGIANPEGDSAGARFGYVGTGLINFGLGLEGLRVALLNRGGSDGNEAPHWTAEAMSKPMGKWLVIGTGLAIAAYGIWQLIRAIKAKLDDQLRLGEIEPRTRTWVRRLARLGIAARGLVFGMIGWFLMRAGLEHDPSQARDLGASIQAFQAAPFGKWVLLSIAVGLLLYGFYNLVRARYRVIHA
jgi:hypothetical protein